MSGLSVVIPCYNSRNTIVKCLMSVETDLMDVEVVVVEDCSVDNSEDLIQEYARNSKLSIKYLKNEKNLGAGNTRNRGINEATKEYITFLDSDDELDEKYFEYVKTPISQGFDIIVYDAVRVFGSDKKTYLNMFYSDCIQEKEYDVKKVLVYIRGCTCGKIYKTDIIKKNDIKFGTLHRNEDLIFTKTATSFTNCVYYINKALYKYNYLETSLFNNNSLTTPQNSIDAFELIKKRLHGLGFEKELNSIYLIEVLFGTTTCLIRLNKSNREIISNYKQYRKMYNSDDIYRKGYSFSFKISYILFEYRLFGVYNFLRKIYKKIR